MDDYHVLMGSLVAALCALGLWQAPWLLIQTRKGRRIAGRLGEQQGLLVIRLFCFAGVVFGVLLAAGIIRPVQW